ncbi:aldo/keto reductase, partial [Streptomyces sp. NPDC057757]
YQVSLEDDVLAYARTRPELGILAYSSLLNGAYVRGDRPVPAEYRHASTAASLAVLAEVAHETGATANQVVYAWMLDGPVPLIPLIGASSVSQLDEALDALDLELTPDQRRRLDTARNVGQQSSRFLS